MKIKARNEVHQLDLNSVHAPRSGERGEDAPGAGCPRSRTRRARVDPASGLSRTFPVTKMQSLSIQVPTERKVDYSPAKEFDAAEDVAINATN